MDAHASRCVYVHMCEGQRPASGVIPQMPSPLVFVTGSLLDIICFSGNSPPKLMQAVLISSRRRRDGKEERRDMCGTYKSKVRQGGQVASCVETEKQPQRKEEAVA